MTSSTASRQIWLVADDYGISPGVNVAIRDLLGRGRISATSVMMVGPALGRGEIEALQEAAALNPGSAIGLHATLTAPFAPLTMHFRPLDGGMFLPLGAMLRVSVLRRLDADLLATELTAQIDAFAQAFGRAPDYVDGHQHVQLFPQVRDAFLRVIKAHAPSAWVRQCGRTQAWSRRLDQPKALLLDVLSAGFRQRAARAGIRFNSGFAGAYDFGRANDFEQLLANFLDRLPAGGLIMCHPGHVDDVLISLDPFTDQREREYAYLGSDRFASLLATHNVTLARHRP